MTPRNRQGPATRANAPTGPGKLSVPDGSKGSLLPADGQSSDADGPVVTILVAAAPNRPGYYTAQLPDGRVLTCSRMPFCDGARALLGTGIDPAATLVMMHAGSLTESLRGPIGAAARLTVEESAHGPVFRTYRKPSRSAVEAPSIRSRVRAATPYRACSHVDGR
jgi:hypothetical protein